MQNRSLTILMLLCSSILIAQEEVKHWSKSRSESATVPYPPAKALFDCYSNNGYENAIKTGNVEEIDDEKYIITIHAFNASDCGENWQNFLRGHCYEQTGKNNYRMIAWSKDTKEFLSFIDIAELFKGKEKKLVNSSTALTNCKVDGEHNNYRKNMCRSIKAHDTLMKKLEEFAKLRNCNSVSIECARMETDDYYESSHQYSKARGTWEKTIQ